MRPDSEATPPPSLGTETERERGNGREREALFWSNLPKRGGEEGRWGGDAGDEVVKRINVHFFNPPAARVVRLI